MTIEGTPADFTPPALGEGFVVSAPQVCPHDEAYIRIERTIGARQIGKARNRGGGFDEGCMKLPADAAECPVVNAAPLFAAAGAKLQAANVKGAGGSGLGPCGDIQGDYDAWNFSVGVVSWRDAATAVGAVAEQLAAHDVRGYLGVAIRAIPCATIE